MCSLTVDVISKASNQQSPISKVLEKSKVVWGFVSTPNLHLFKGQLYIYLL